MQYQGDSSLFQDATLVVPSVSYANLSQLTVDLLINSLGLSRIGVLGDGSTVVPMVGQLEQANNPEKADIDPALTSGGLEVYGRSGCSYIFLQQRSPVLKSRKSEHIGLISTFIRSHPFSSVLLLTSLDISTAAEDESVLMSPWRSLLPPSAAKSPNATIENLKEIPPYVQEAVYDSLREGGPSKSEATAYPPPLPAGGLSGALLADLQKEGSGTVPPHGALCAWCVEGDNRGDAFGMAGVVAFVLGIEKSLDLKQPLSWEGLFGGEGVAGGTGRESDIYG